MTLQRIDDTVKKIGLLESTDYLVDSERHDLYLQLNKLANEYPEHLRTSVNNLSLLSTSDVIVLWNIYESLSLDLPNQQPFFIDEIERLLSALESYEIVSDVKLALEGYFAHIETSKHEKPELLEHIRNSLLRRVDSTKLIARQLSVYYLIEPNLEDYDQKVKTALSNRKDDKDWRIRYLIFREGLIHSSDASFLDKFRGKLFNPWKDILGP